MFIKNRHRNYLQKNKDPTPSVLYLVLISCLICLAQDAAATVDDAGAADLSDTSDASDGEPAGLAPLLPVTGLL